MESEQIEQAKTALLGWSLHAIEAAHHLNKPVVVVGPKDYVDFAEKHHIDFIDWEFKEPTEESEHQLYDLLVHRNVQSAIPIYEETVEWAGAINAKIQDDRKIAKRAMLLRNKALMKRKAQMAGIKVGVFEEGSSKEDIVRFFRRVNEALLRMDGDNLDPIHVKAFNKAGSVGHRVIRQEQDIDSIEDQSFPCLMESHLDGQEFSCEAFIHDGKIRFLNVTEYVELGYSNFLPASPTLLEHREKIRETIMELIDAFEIKNGVIHPEFFLHPRTGKLYFGEIAGRVPGGHIFELMEKAYGFSAFQAHILCSDPHITEKELSAFFPHEDTFHGHAGCLMVYPQTTFIQSLHVPKDLEEHPLFEKHNMFQPAPRKVEERNGYGNHYGTIYFFGDDCEEMKTVLKKYKEHRFFH